MPLTRSAIKAARQSEARRVRRLPYKTRMKTVMRSVTDAVKAKDTDTAVKLLPLAYKLIDTAAKKHIIHQRNAARKKSRMARLVTSLPA